MPTPNFSELVNIVNDKAVLKILFYLREFNPNVSVNDLCTNLALEENTVKDKLNKLQELGIVSNTNAMYQLTTDGRRIVNSFYHNLGEPIPKDK